MKADLDDLIKMSRKYGSNEQYVLPGWGNTSYKAEGILYVKASGADLKSVALDDFVAVSIEKLLEILGLRHDDKLSLAEKNEIADDMMKQACLDMSVGSEFDKSMLKREGDNRNACSGLSVNSASGGMQKTPSVESILHAMFPYRFVLHLHPAIINGLIYASNGKELFGQIFGDSAVWVGRATPGFSLAAACYDAFGIYFRQHSMVPKLVFLENHGVFVAEDSVDEVDKITQRAVSDIKRHIAYHPSMEEVAPLTIEWSKR